MTRPNLTGSHRNDGTADAYTSTVAALAMGQLVCWAALYYAFSSFVLPMQRDLGWSKPELMGAFTTGLAVWGAVSYLAGAAIDRGHHRLVLAGGALLGGCGFVSWSQVHGLPALYMTWGVLGAAMAMTLYEPAFNVLTKRYPDRYVRAITTLALVGGFASTLSFPASDWLIGRLGWREALLVIGGVMTLVVAPLHAWALSGTPTANPRMKAISPPNDATLRQAFRERAFWLLTANMALYTFAAAALWAHIVPALATKGHGPSESLTIVMLLGPAQVGGRLLHLLFARVLPTRLVGLIVMAGLPVSLAIFALGERWSVLMMFAVLFGFANGLVTVIRGSIIPEYFGREHLGKISGTMTGIALVTRATAPFVTALLLANLPSYRELLLVLSGVGVAALAAFAVARPPQLGHCRHGQCITSSSPHQKGTPQ